MIYLILGFCAWHVLVLVWVLSLMRAAKGDE